MPDDQPRPGLGRRFAPDPRDRRFAMRAIAPDSTREYRYWNDNGWWGDQGTTSQCVAYSLLHWLEDGPVAQRGAGPVVDPAVLYAEAQAVDEWDGPPPPYDGTSVRAGAKALQARGFISAYHWAESLDDIVNAILEVGPVVVGTNWYEGMDNADAMGFLNVEGRIRGGHAYVVNGVSRPRKVLRIKNSWNRDDFGNNGRALISFDDMARLLAEQGEAMLAVEVKK